MPAFATIESGSTCDTVNLGQSENNSTANVEADWTANIININWYIDDESQQTMAQTTCTYDGTITLPQEPAKTGYTFTGWRVRAIATTPVQCDLSGLNDTTTNGTSYGYAPATNQSLKEEQYGLTPKSDEWATEFYHGIIKGQSVCSTSGNGMDMGQTGNPVAGGGQYCWCKPTSYTSKTSESQCDVSESSSWVFATEFYEDSACASTCANACANGVKSFASLRSAVFGAVKQ